MNLFIANIKELSEIKKLSVIFIFIYPTLVYKNSNINIELLTGGFLCVTSRGTLETELSATEVEEGMVFFVFQVDLSLSSLGTAGQESAQDVNYIIVPKSFL